MADEPHVVKQGWLLKRGTPQAAKKRKDAAASHSSRSPPVSPLSLPPPLPGEYIRNLRQRWFQLKSDGSFRGCASAERKRERGRRRRERG